MTYNRRADSFVRNGKVNVGTVAAVELQDWPYRRTHLLTLHVGGVTGNTESQESNKRRDDRVIPTGAAPLVFPPARRRAYRRRSKCQSGDELPRIRLTPPATQSSAQRDWLCAREPSRREARRSTRARRRT